MLKNRMYLPAETLAETGKNVILTKMPNYYQIFMLERINDLVDSLQ